MSFSLPRFGLGTSPLGNRRAALSDETAFEIVRTVAEHAPVLFDTAPLYGYGLAEERLGRALAGADPATRPIITKVGRILARTADGGTAHPGYVALPGKGTRYDYSHHGALLAFEASSERLGRKRVEALLIHDLGRSAHGDAAEQVACFALTGAWPALVRLKSEGRAASIGLAVTEWEVCDWWLDRAEPDLFLIAGRLTLLDDEIPQRFLDRCVERGVEVLVAAPFASGLLADPREGAFHQYRPATSSKIERARELGRICRDHGADLLSTALHFPFTRPGVTSVVAGASTVEQAEALVQAMAACPTADLWPALARVRHRTTQAQHEHTSSWRMQHAYP